MLALLFKTWLNFNQIGLTDYSSLTRSVFFHHTRQCTQNKAKVLGILVDTVGTSGYFKRLNYGRY